jgi:eukaryotic-like serine/threonine-protein kinase
MANNETILNRRYRLVAQQGSGGMAVIYKAVDLELGRTVAIKILRPSLTVDPAFLTRFRNEARAVANLNHPNIVTVFDVGNEAQTHYMVMEFIDGQDLKRIIKTDGVLPVDRALKLAIQICAGIGFAHRAGLVHADVKPQNMLVTRGDVVKVTDFGIAQALSDTQPGEKVSVVWGSPHYFAPEQARGEHPTPASDVYSIGIVMFEMLTGRLPYVGTNQQELALAHIRERVPLVSEYNPSVPETLSQIVYKVMSKEPAARYRTADQLGHVLESYRDRGQQPTMNNVQAFPPPAQPPQQSQPSQPSAANPLPYSQGQPRPPQTGQPSMPIAPGQRPPSAPLPFSQQQSPAQGQPQTPLPYTQAQQAQPTQRYNVAPNAPNANPYNRPAVPSPFDQNAQQFPPQNPQQPWSGGTSQQFYSRPLDREDVPPALDVVTVALAVLAFFAVLCLIPLWIQVYIARFSGG